MNPKPTIGTAIVSACLLNWRAVGCGTAEAAAADEDDEEEEEEHARLPRRATARAARLSIIYFSSSLLQILFGAISDRPSIGLDENEADARRMFARPCVGGAAPRTRKLVPKPRALNTATDGHPWRSPASPRSTPP
jgi:hypothetical protein